MINLFFIFSILIKIYVCKQDKCRILSFRSGGDLGSYEAGAAFYLLSQLGQESQYDVISGISFGSLNAAVLASYEKEDQTSAAIQILDLWQKIKRSDIYQSWPYGVFEGFRDKKGFFDSSPLRKNLEQWVGIPKRHLAIGATNADSAEFEVFKCQYKPKDGESEQQHIQHLIDQVMASSATPILLPFQNIEGNNYVDGGALNDLDIGQAINECLKIVDSDENIIVDTIISLDMKDAKPIDASQITAVQMISRYFEITKPYQNTQDFQKTKEDFPNVDFRLTISPQSSISEWFNLKFSHKIILKNIIQGIDDTRNQVGKLSLLKQDAQNDDLLNQVINQLNQELQDVEDQMFADDGLHTEDVKFLVSLFQ